MKQNPQKSQQRKALYNKAPVRAVFRKNKLMRGLDLVKNALRTRAIAALDFAKKFAQQHNLTTLHKQPARLKRILQVGVLALLVIIPIKRLLIKSPVEKDAGLIAQVTHKKILTIASVEDVSVIYNQNGLLHGFGYDIARQYAKHLGIELAFITYPDAQEALKALEDGAADMALVSSQTNITPIRPSASIACHPEQATIIKQAGLDDGLMFVINDDKEQTQQEIQGFLCNPQTQSNIGYLAKFYDNTLLKNAYNRKHFDGAMRKLPLFEYAFRTSAKEFQQDWQTLAMIGYQESRFDSHATSFTGVQGMMMLTQDTAKEMGVKDRTNTTQSIHGGTKYFTKLQKQFAHIPASDRLWFVLAAYNMGPNAVRDIQNALKSDNQDPNSWLNVYKYLVNNAHKNSRYEQCIKYVTNIRSYLEDIKSRKNAQSATKI